MSTQPLVNPIDTGRWAVKSVVWCRDNDEAEAKLRRTLRAGWEPFQVLNVDEGREIWFRRWESRRWLNSAPLDN